MDRRRSSIALLALVVVIPVFGVAIVVARRRDVDSGGATGGASAAIGSDAGPVAQSRGDLAARPTLAPVTAGAASSVPLVENVDKLVIAAQVAGPEGVRLDGIRFDVEVFEGERLLVALGAALTDAKGRCAVGPVAVPTVPRSSVAAGVRRWPYVIDSATPWQKSSASIRLRASGRADLRVQDAAIALSDVAAPRQSDWGVTVVDGGDGVRTITVPLRSETNALLRGRVVDRRGHPLAGARVAASAEPLHVSDPTGADGRFERELPKAGRVSIDVTFPLFDDRLEPVLRRDVDVAPGPAVTAIDFVVEGLVSIEGRVIDEHARPLAGVPLALVTAGSSVSEARLEARLSSYAGASPRCVRVRSADDGTFRFVGLPPNRRFEVRWWDDERVERPGPMNLAPDARDVVVTVSPRHGIRVQCVDSDTRASIAAAVHVESVSSPASEADSWLLADPGEDGFRGKPGETLRIVAEADRYDTAILDRVVLAAPGLEDVTVPLTPARSRARVVVRVIDESGVAWPDLPALRWTYDGATFDAQPERSQRASDPTNEVDEFETRSLSPGRYLLRPEYDACGLPWSGALRFAVPGERVVDVPTAGEVAAALPLQRGGALRIAIQGKNGEAMSVGDMTSLSARRPDGASIELRIFAKERRRGSDSAGWSEGVHGVMPHETQALPTGIYTVEWTGGRHRGTPAAISAAARVVSGEITDVVIVDPR